MNTEKTEVKNGMEYTETLISKTVDAYTYEFEETENQKIVFVGEEFEENGRTYQPVIVYKK